eukprot:scaffold950_cov360-Pavlova_lutheri.AAC.21
MAGLSPPSVPSAPPSVFPHPPKGRCMLVPPSSVVSSVTTSTSSRGLRSQQRDSFVSAFVRPEDPHRAYGARTRICGLPSWTLPELPFYALALLLQPSFFVGDAPAGDAFRGGVCASMPFVRLSFFSMEVPHASHSESTSVHHARAEARCANGHEVVRCSCILDP